MGGGGMGGGGEAAASSAGDKLEKLRDQRDEKLEKLAATGDKLAGAFKGFGGKMGGASAYVLPSYHPFGFGAYEAPSRRTNLTIPHTLATLRPRNLITAARGTISMAELPCAQPR